MPNSVVSCTLADSLKGGSVRRVQRGQPGLQGKMAGKEFWMTAQLEKTVISYKINAIHICCSAITVAMSHMPDMCRACAGPFMHMISFTFYNRLTGSYYCYHHFIDEETEAQRHEETCQGHGAVKWGDRFELRQVTSRARVLNQPLPESGPHYRQGRRLTTSHLKPRGEREQARKKIFHQGGVPGPSF